MAGMLAGVEAARRRRFHLSGGVPGGSSPSTAVSGGSGAGLHACSRRPSFCLMTSQHDHFHRFSVSSLGLKQQMTCEPDEKLGPMAREAKERLDERLRSQKKSQITSDVCEVRNTVINGSTRETQREVQLQTEVYGTKRKKGGAKILSWVKKGGRKASPWEEEECTVCL